ncbi:MAG: GYF domain-containing protein [Verrucomicrobiales bacterium]|jgi:hypothetical protein|nr:GYF domain-containing protein [Verrucomicrobiales bacterium]
MKDYYYCLDGVTVNGPLSAAEIRELLESKTLTAETLVCSAGEKDWVPLNAISLPQVETLKAPSTETAEETADKDNDTTVDLKAIASAGNDEDDDHDDHNEEQGITKSKLISAIRKDLDLLWKAQRESIIAEIKNVHLSEEYETTRKEAKLTKQRVREAVFAYWQKSKMYHIWIDELVWKECDIQRKLKGDDCESKYEDACNWLEKARLIDKAGCYCFKKDKEYLYIGKAGGGDSNLGKRLTNHKRSVYFEQATHLRVIIPRHKTWISKLERLLLLAYPETRYNEATPNRGNNPADNILDFIEKEMNDLLADG